MEILHLLGRLLFGGFFLYNALNHLVLGTAGLAAYAAAKGVPAPRAAVILTGLLLLVGGALLVLGYAPKLAVLLLLVFLVPVSFKMHAFWAEQGEARMMDLVQFSKNMAMAGALLMLLPFPEPWPYALGR